MRKGLESMEEEELKLGFLLLVFVVAAAEIEEGEREMMG